MFALSTPTLATVRTFNLRTEKHGDDDVHAIDLGLRVTGSSAMLDMLHPSLRELLYLPPLSVQAVIEGEEHPWTVLRCDAVPGVSVKGELIGRFVTLSPATEIESALAEDDELGLADSKASKFHVTAHAGGSVDIDLRVQCADVDAETIGFAGALLNQAVRVTIIHTEVPPNETRPTDSPPTPQKDATTLFAEGGEGGEAEPAAVH